MSKPGIRFMWKSQKRTGKQHIQGPDGRTLCLIEKGGGKTDRVSDEPDPRRDICAICTSLYASGKREQEFRQGISRAKKSRPTGRKRGRPGCPPSEYAWESSPLGRRFAHLMDGPDD